MNKALPFFVAFVILIATSCQDKRADSLADFVDLEKIEKAEMHNNSGDFVLNSAQLSQLKKDLRLLTNDPSMSVKVGAIRLILTIQGQTYSIFTSTHGDYAEVDVSMFDKPADKPTQASSYFKMNGVNFDNYKNRML